MPWLTSAIRPKLYAHIRMNTKAKLITIDAINGYADHMHLLIPLGSGQTKAKVDQLIESESSYWISHELLARIPFE